MSTRGKQHSFRLTPSIFNFPVPFRGRPSVAFLLGSSFDEVVAERQREVPPSLAYSIVKVHYLPGGEIKGQDTTCSVRAVLSRLDN